MSKNTIRVALLLDCESIQEWHRIALHEMVKQTPATIDLLIINDGSDNKEARNARSNVTPWQVYNAFRSKIESDRNLRFYRQRHHISNADMLSNVERRHCKAVTTDGLGNELPADVVEELSSCDIAVRFGFGILVGDALSAPKFGVLSFHHGNLKKYRGRPAGFWEFVEGSPTAGITLQRLSETLDGGGIVLSKSIDISSAPSWPTVMAKLLSESKPMLAEGVEILTDPDRELENPNELGELYFEPEWRDLGRYVLRRFQRALSS